MTSIPSVIIGPSDNRVPLIMLLAALMPLALTSCGEPQDEREIEGQHETDVGFHLGNEWILILGGGDGSVGYHTFRLTSSGNLNFVKPIFPIEQDHRSSSRVIRSVVWKQGHCKLTRHSQRNAVNSLEKIIGTSSGKFINSDIADGIQYACTIDVNGEQRSWYYSGIDAGSIKGLFNQLREVADKGVECQSMELWDVGDNAWRNMWEGYEAW